jgi:hypothetical protein
VVSLLATEGEIIALEVLEIVASSQSRLLPATASAVGLVSFSLGSLESRAAARAVAVARKEQQSCPETGPLAALKSLPKLSTAESEVMARIISARKRLGR